MKRFIVIISTILILFISGIASAQSKDNQFKIDNSYFSLEIKYNQKKFEEVFYIKYLTNIWTMLKNAKVDSHIILTEFSEEKSKLGNYLSKVF